MPLTPESTPPEDFVLVNPAVSPRLKSNAPPEIMGPLK